MITYHLSSMVMWASFVLSWAYWAWVVVGFPQLGPSWKLLEVGLIQLGHTWVTGNNFSHIFAIFFFTRSVNKGELNFICYIELLYSKYISLFVKANKTPDQFSYTRAM